ncbi:MAG: NAD(P) transhydrogenase subunit alpha [Clostridiales bacterium]|jgi:NAD(P) transhydrogenase subunit alpha|nr:NAD(P) transhydrogenase subunit alpha [Clostridiales bacterium]
MSGIVLIAVFVLSSIIGYVLIKNVPSLLHTPLMSGMNALSGITVLGALAATGAAVATSNRVLGYIAILLAMINVAGGFGVTHRMLKMFKGGAK